MFYREFYGNIDTCADSVYQALFSPLKGPGDEAIAPYTTSFYIEHIVLPRGSFMTSLVPRTHPQKEEEGLAHFKPFLVFAELACHVTSALIKLHNRVAHTCTRKKNAVGGSLKS